MGYTDPTAFSASAMNAGIGHMQNSGKLNSFSAGGPISSGSAGGGTNQQQIQYRGYSPSKPKWKAQQSNLVGMPQTNNLMGGSGVGLVQGYSAAAVGSSSHHGMRQKSSKH